MRKISAGRVDRTAEATDCMRTTDSFTIKQCNQVADAWNVVCGPEAPRSHLSLSTLSSVVPPLRGVSPPLKGSPARFLFSFCFLTPFALLLSLFLRELFTFYNPEGGDSSTLLATKIAREFRVSFHPTVINEFSRRIANQRRIEKNMFLTPSFSRESLPKCRKISFSRHLKVVFIERNAFK